MEPDRRVYGGAARTGAADRIRDRREGGPGLLSRFPGMAYQCRNDADWTMDLVSDGCRALTGYEPEALVNGEVTYGAIIHPEDRDRVWDEVQRAIDQGHPAFEFEYRIVRTDGEVRDVLEQGHPVRSEGGELLGLEGFVTDITERRALEEQLRHAQRVEGLGELTGAIAHDFNNYLTAIIAPIEMVLETLPEGESREDLVQARDAAMSAATLTGHLLSFSRRRVHSPRPVRLDELMRALRYMLDRVTGERIRIEYGLDAGESVVMVDPSQLQQVIVNLVVNARDAMPDGGRVWIRTRTEESGPARLGPAAPGPWVSIAVEDGGIGIDEATRARVFDPYFTTKATGTGLGLSTAFGIVKQHGGEIRVDSTPGEGATFTILFPVTDRAPDTEPDVRPTAPAPGRAPASRTTTVLVVEDEEAVRRVVVAALERFGYTVVAAGSGERALAVERVHRGPVDLLLTDLTLPDVTGSELADQLRGRRPGLPVLIMSGYTPQDVLQGGEGNPPFAFLEKPFMIDALLRAVAAALEGEPPPARQIGSG